ncbi:MAG: type I secretion system permease/ATPase [Azonexus sp.]
MKQALQKRDELAEVIRGFKSIFVTVAVFSFFSNMLMLTPSIYMMQVYDRVLASRNETTLIVLTIMTLGLFGLMTALEAVRTRVLARIGARFDIILNSRVFTAVFERNLVSPGGNTSQSLGDFTTLRTTLTGNAVVALMDLPWMPIYLIVIFVFNVHLGVFALIGALSLVALTILNEKITKESLEQAQKLGIQANTQATNNLRNAEIIEALGMLPAVHKRWFGLHEKFLNAQNAAADKAAIMGGVTKFVRISMQSLVLGYGALLTIEGSMTAGMMIAASILVGRALAPVELLIGNWKQIAVARAAYRRVQLLLLNHPERKAGMKLPKPKGLLTVEGASTAAPGTKTMILRGISLAVAPGEVLAVIGPSASGKSSLARLLVGVWPALGGNVRLDGADVYQWNKDELGPNIGYLPQDIELFDGTIAENIARFGDVDAEKVVAAAKHTGMHEAILRMPNGYDSRLGEAGSFLSGGQRQRIGLARALYGDPTLVVLDEPNSNLDDQGELALAQTVHGLKQRGATVVVITHRMSTLSVCDKILILQEGVAKAFGPRDQVLAALAQQQQQQQNQNKAARPQIAAAVTEQGAESMAGSNV